MCSAKVFSTIVSKFFEQFVFAGGLFHSTRVLRMLALICECSEIMIVLHDCDIAIAKSFISKPETIEQTLISL